MISYKEISERIKNNNGLVLTLNVMDKAITYITVLLYLGFLAFAFLQIPEDKGLLLYRSILVPGVSFIIVSIYRKLISSPRPYEVYDFTPALKKDTIGKSFPSRHVFSIFIVAFTVFQASIPLGAVICLLGVALAVIRVVGGVHFIKDVVAGFAIAATISIICYGIFSGVFGLLMLPF
ncbi:PAP2 superfamily protein [Pseudobutyrivibrio sp. OR37]|uniref:phosphatase PAP2 family protein n=1 Tax=Pseudobutyrivibrio sp. OR37 TaxID=1798186 RepID=UPI0008EA5911|nr:phosphatase PAP2 family protein [Pseudobutyrivibrio sp. OR37]SFH54739.1 PAP2 superfamily protein [Pseudobutyrivibrio sp. OR37]